MDLSFSAIPQRRISSAFSPSSQCLTSSRREFFGSGNQPWVQGLRYRTILWKLGFHIETPRCATFLDSVCESSILVMSATAAVFIAIPLAILDSEGRKNSKNKCSEIENSDALARGEWHENANFAKNQCTLKQLSHTEAISRKPCNAEGMTVVSRVPAIISSMKDDTLVSKDREMLNYQKALSHIVEKFSLFPIINMPSKNGFDESNACLIVGNIKSTIRNSHVFDKRDFISGKRGKVLVYSYLQSFKPPPISSFFVSSLRRKATVDSKSYYHWGHQHIAGRNEILVTGDNGIYDRSVKENTYYCTEQIDKRSLTCFYGISEKPLSHSFQSKSEYCDTRHSLIRALALQKKSSKYTERQVLVKCKQTSSTKDNGIENGPSSTRDIGKTTMLKKASHLSWSLQPNGSVVNDSRNLENFLRIYDCLLRDARLEDCLDLLEIMEREGLLDMDKVHHTRFLNACKSQKAVKEAFCFCKLIKNPRLSTFNMLLSVCANAQDFDGAFKVMLLMKEAGLKPDCKLYTTLISTCGKCGKVDSMFEVFHEMVNAGVEPNVNTYGALIDGCARAGQLAKAFGVYGIMSSKNVQPDRVVFNALITACGQSGAVDRAFDVLAEMRAEPKPIDPDDVTIGALVKTCIQCGQAKRAREVYKMLRLYNIKGTPDVYTIAVNSCSLNGDLEFAFKIYDDMKQNGVEPDEMFLSAIIDVSGHAQNVDAAFGILKDARNRGILVGNMTYSSLMGACCNAKNWEKALELYEDIKAIELLPTVSTLNALVTALCDGDQLPKCFEVLDEMTELGVLPNIVTYSVLIVACEKKDEAELGFTLFSKAKREGILPNLIMCRCLTGLCLRSYLKACSRGEPIVSFNSGKPQIDSIWTSRAIMVYRETVSSGVIPTIEVFSQVLGCLQFPRDSLLRNRFIEDLGISSDASRCSNISLYLHGFGEYDTRSFPVLEEAASLQVVQRVSFKESPIVLDARKQLTHTVEVYILMILKGLRHRLAAG